MGVKEFYENMYRDDKPERPKPSLYSSILEHTLGRFVINRYEQTYKLLPGGGSILDIGCGEDLALMPLWTKYREVYGIDISEPRIKRLQKQLGNNPAIHLSAEDVNDKLSFRDASFDTIMSIAVLEHIFDPYHFMKECHRLLKPGGLLLVHVPNIAWLGNRLRLFLGRLPVTSTEEGWDGGHLHYFTVASLRELFQKEGFEITKIVYGGPSRRFWGSLLSELFLVAGTKK